MAKEKMTMPQSTAGLVRYFDDYKEAIQISPQTVVGVCVGIIVLEIFLRIFFI